MKSRRQSRGCQRCKRRLASFLTRTMTRTVHPRRLCPSCSSMQEAQHFRPLSTPELMLPWMLHLQDEAFLLQHKPERRRLAVTHRHGQNHSSAALSRSAAALPSSGTQLKVIWLHQHADEDVEIAVCRYSSEEDSCGSDSEVIEFVTPRVGAETDATSEAQYGEHKILTLDEAQNVGSSDSPRESWIQPVIAGQCASAEGELAEEAVSNQPSATAQPADTGQALRRHRVRLPASHSRGAHLRPVHVRHVEAAQSNLAALHWRLLREDRLTLLVPTSLVVRLFLGAVFCQSFRS